MGRKGEGGEEGEGRRGEERRGEKVNIRGVGGGRGKTGVGRGGEQREVAGNSKADPPSALTDILSWSRGT